MTPRLAMLGTRLPAALQLAELPPEKAALRRAALRAVEAPARAEAGPSYLANGSRPVKPR